MKKRKKWRDHRPGVTGITCHLSKASQGPPVSVSGFSQSRSKKRVTETGRFLGLRDAFWQPESGDNLGRGLLPLSGHGFQDKPWGAAVSPKGDDKESSEPLSPGRCLCSRSRLSTVVCPGPCRLLAVGEWPPALGPGGLGPWDSSS